MTRITALLLALAACPNKSSIASAPAVTWSGIPVDVPGACFWHPGVGAAQGTCIVRGAVYACVYVENTNHYECARSSCAAQPQTPEAP